MNNFAKKAGCRYVQFGCLLLAALLCSAAAFAGQIRVTGLQYPKSPETLTIGEKVPVVVTVEYSNLAGALYKVRIAYADYPPRFQSGGQKQLSGSGSYTFPPAEIMVPADYSMPGGWPKFINEWHLKAQVWKGDEKAVAGKAFTLLVENPAHQPSLEIGSIDYVVPPDTIAVKESTQIKVHVAYTGLDAGTKAELTLRDRSGILASKLSRVIAGSGEYVYTVAIKPKTSGPWTIEASVQTVAGSMPFGAKKSFMIQVVN